MKKKYTAAWIFLTAAVWMIAAQTQSGFAAAGDHPAFLTATPTQMEENEDDESDFSAEEELYGTGEADIQEENGVFSGEEGLPDPAEDEPGGSLAVISPLMKTAGMTKGAGLLGASLNGNVADWERMQIGASYNGGQLILSFDLEFYAGGGGTQLFAPRISLNPTPSFYGGILYWGEGTMPTSNYGTLNLSRYNRSMGTSEAERFLTLAGTLAVNENRLSSFNADGELNLYAGGWGEGWQSYGNFKIVPEGWETAYRQATCSHPSRTCTYLSDSQHEVKCAACGYSFGKEAHSISAGKCSGCGHTFTVSGTISYTINGRTYSENYTVLPGSQYKPKDFTGYITPTVTIPASGGNVKVTYTPITYYIFTEGKSYTLKYDETVLIAGSPRKGYTQELYVVKEVS